MKQDHLGAKTDLTRFESVVCGGAAGLVSRFVIAPLDVVKIRLQLNVASPQYKPGTTIWNTVKNIAKNEGVTALWKGNIPAEAMYVLYGALQFTTYKQISKWCAEANMNEQANSFISGATAGTVATSLTYPFDLLRTRFAAQGKDRVYTSISQGVRHIYSHENGLKAFFRGLPPAIYSIVPYMGTFFLTYEELRKLLDRSRFSALPAPEASAGFAAGVISKTVVFPLDLIRKRIQVQGPTRKRFGSLPVYSSSVVTCTKQILVKEGFRGLYKGYFISLFKNAPFTAVSIWSFERSIDVLNWAKKRELL